MYNQTDDVKGIKTVGAIVIIAFFIIVVMNIYEVLS